MMLKMKFIQLAFLCCLMFGCTASYYAEAEYSPVPANSEVYITPPVPLVEEIPPPPFEEAVWVYGYWAWSGSSYYWVDGRYVQPPRVGVIWYPGGYIYGRRGYIYVRGRWAPPGYRSPYRFIHPTPPPRRYMRHYHRPLYHYRSPSSIPPPHYGPPPSKRVYPAVPTVPPPPPKQAPGRMRRRAPPHR